MTNDWDTPIRELAIVPPGLPEASRSAVQSGDALTKAVKHFFAVWDRCGGSEAVSAKEFADARQAMRDAISEAPARCPHCGEIGDHDGYCGVC